MGWRVRGARLAVALLSAVPSGVAEAARGRTSMPKPRGPKPPKKLPASVERPVAIPPAWTPLSPTGLVGRYADSLEALSPEALRWERSGAYVYCLRVTGVYEHIYYGASGRVRRDYSTTTQHGTGFAYMRRGAETYLATNDHVVSLPEVTGELSLDGVPPGSRKVSQSIHIVSSEGDTWSPGFIELSRVLSDPSKDLAVLKTSRPLQVMPYGLGGSSDLRAGNAVFARGYPLGVMPTLNAGRVTNPAQLDTDAGWDHLDFITDAALNDGNSGSPVFAIAADTGVPELVGIFHAHYREAMGLGVVVGIDQLRERLLELKPPPPVAAVDPSVEGWRRLSEEGGPVFFPFAGMTARALEVEEGVRFELFDEFPLSETPMVALVTDARRLIVLAVPERSATRTAAERVAPLREPVRELELELWRGLANTLALREAASANDGSPEARRTLALLRRAATGNLAQQREVLSVVRFETEAPRPAK